MTAAHTEPGDTQKDVEDPAARELSVQETTQAKDNTNPGTQSVLDLLYKYVLMVLLSAILMSAGAVAAMIWMKPVMGINVQNAFLCIP